MPDHFREIVTYLECLNTKFKIIALTETWLKDHHTNYTLPNYNFEQTFRPKARGGGVCLYIHSSLQYKMRRDLIPTNQNIIKNSKHHQKEVNSLFIEIDKKSTLTKHNIIVGCIYRPTSYPLHYFNELLGEILCKLESEKKYVYTTGDFNCNTLVSNTSTEEFKNILSSNHFYPLINRLTRITKSSATLIDNIYCNMPNISNTMAAGLLHANISDHKGIYCIDNNTSLSKKDVLISTRNFSKRNILKFTFNIHKEKWDFVHNLPVQSAFRQFLGVIVQHFENSFPKRTFTLTYKTRLPWMTPDLRQQTCEKNAMYKATLSGPQNKELLIGYKKNKNSLHSQLKKTLKYFTTQMN